jgi:hypothetical protein
MRATFEFNLPADQYEYEMMHQSIRMGKVLWDLSEQLRAWEKYGHQFKDADDALSKTREEFHRLLTDYEVNIDL